SPSRLLKVPKNIFPGWTTAAAESAKRLFVAVESSDVEQRLFEVGDNVFYVLDADREAHEPLSDAHAILHFPGQGSVPHHRGKRNQSFDSTEAFGERADLDVMEASPA